MLVCAYCRCINIQSQAGNAGLLFVYIKACVGSSAWMFTFLQFLSLRKLTIVYIFQAEAIMSRMNISDYQKEGDQPTLLITSDIVCVDYLCSTALDRIWMVIHKYVINTSIPQCGFSLVFLYNLKFHGYYLNFCIYASVVSPNVNGVHML